MIDKSADDLWLRVQNIDLKHIKNKVLKEYESVGVTEENIADIERAYRQFLYLSVKHSDRALVPTYLCDKFWHTHILATQKYEEDCSTALGCFIHHFPVSPDEAGGASKDEEEENFKVTQDLFIAEFGEPQFGELAAECCSCCTSSKRNTRVL